LALTDALAVSVKLQVLVLLPALEQAPDQMASRPLVTLSVTGLLLAKPADWALPTATLMPAGLDVTRSPLRPLTVTVSVAVALGALTVSVAVRVTPASTAEMTAEVGVAGAVVATVKVALVAPAATVTLAGTLATAVLLLDRLTKAPPAAAALVKLTLPCALPPPVTLVGLSVRLFRLAGGGGGGTGVTVSVVDRLVP
jgi:hypothetical protein